MPKASYKIASSPVAAAEYLASRISMLLSKGLSASWFVSGGSTVAVAVLAAGKISSDTSKLSIMLADERFGPPGHEDSNWRQLLDGGFAVSGAKMYPVLTGQSASLTLKHYLQNVEDLLAKDYKIALLGIGADGHTAGILPQSAAAKSKKLAEYYETPQFKRLTLTFNALSLMDEAVVYAVGGSKTEAVSKLSRSLPTENQPAQIIKRIPRVTIFNSLKEGDV